MASYFQSYFFMAEIHVAPGEPGPTSPGVRVPEISAPSGSIPQNREVARLRSNLRATTLLALATLAGLFVTNRNELIGGDLQVGMDSHVAAYRGKATSDARVQTVQEKRLGEVAKEEAAVAQYEAECAQGLVDEESYPEGSPMRSILSRARNKRNSVKADERYGLKAVPEQIERRRSNVLGIQNWHSEVVDAWEVEVDQPSYKGNAIGAALATILSESELKAIVGQDGEYDFSSIPWAQALSDAEGEWSTSVNEGGYFSRVGEVVDFEGVKSPAAVQGELDRLQGNLAAQEATLARERKNLEITAEEARGQIKKKAQADLAAIPSASVLAQQIHEYAQSRLKEVDAQLATDVAELMQRLGGQEESINEIARASLAENEVALRKNLGLSGRVFSYFVGGAEPVLDPVEDCHDKNMQFKDPTYCEVHALAVLNCTSEEGGTAVVETVCDDGKNVSMRPYTCSPSEPLELVATGRRTTKEPISGYRAEISTSDLCERVQSGTWSTRLTKIER